MAWNGGELRLVNEHNGTATEYRYMGSGREIVRQIRGRFVGDGRGVVSVPTDRRLTGWAILGTSIMLKYGGGISWIPRGAFLPSPGFLPDVVSASTLVLDESAIGYLGYRPEPPRLINGHVSVRDTGMWLTNERASLLWPLSVDTDD